MSGSCKLKKPFYTRWWFWTTAIILFMINLILAIKFPREQPNTFTAISGWISGIATVILGIIAYTQNAKYEKDNTVYLEEQKRLLQQTVEENKTQNSFFLRNRDYQELNIFKEELKQLLIDFMSEHTPFQMSSFIFYSMEKYLESKYSTFSHLMQIRGYCEKEKMHIGAMVICLKRNHYGFAVKKETIVFLDAYMRQLHDIGEKYSESDMNLEKLMTDTHLLDLLKPSFLYICDTITRYINEVEQLLLETSDTTIEYERIQATYKTLRDNDILINNEIVEIFKDK